LIAEGGRPHVIVMGAGPAGLTAAYELFKHDIPVTILEKDPNQVGGLARTVEHKGYRFDIGGHRFFSKNQEVEELWTEILGDEMLTRGRLSRIYYRGRFFAYPIKAFNALWNLGPLEAVRCVATSSDGVSSASSSRRTRKRYGASAPRSFPPTGRLSESRASTFGWCCEARSSPVAPPSITARS
jgi:protoporphyrinogen oxidase